MRRDLIHHSDSIFFGIRKTAMDDLGWCYLGPCEMDLDNKVRVVAECLYCSESNEMYSWNMKQLEKVELVYKLKSTHFIFAAGNAQHIRDIYNPGGSFPFI